MALPNTLDQSIYLLFAADEGRLTTATKKSVKVSPNITDFIKKIKPQGNVVRQYQGRNKSFKFQVLVLISFFIF